MNPTLDTTFLLNFSQTVTVAVALVVVILSICTYFFVTERYSESLLGTMIVGSILPLIIGIAMLPPADVETFLRLYSIVFLLPYFFSNVSLFFTNPDSEWVLRHSFAFYGWLVGTILFVLSRSITNYLFTALNTYETGPLVYSVLFVSIVGSSLGVVFHNIYEVSHEEPTIHQFRSILKTIIAKFN